MNKSEILGSNKLFVLWTTDPTKDTKSVYQDFLVKDDKFTVKGKVIVAKNSCMHPGGVRVLEAVENPFLASFMIM